MLSFMPERPAVTSGHRPRGTACDRTQRPLAQDLSKTALLAIGCGSAIVLLAFGIRSSFGLFLQPMSLDLGWGREVFALAMALQNLIWGVSQPLIGMLADRYGSGRTLAAGGLLYALGVFLMATTSTPLDLHLSAGVLLGLALGATGFGVVLAAVGRSVSAERRSMALGITTALGSLGQFLMPPLGQAFLAAYGWQTALMLLAFGSLATVAPPWASRAGPRPPPATTRPCVRRCARPAGTRATST